MGHIKEIKITGVCAGADGQDKLKELIISESTTSSYVVLEIGKDLVEVNAKSVINAIDLIINPTKGVSIES